MKFLFKTPFFWRQKNLCSRLLTPLSWIYQAVCLWRYEKETPYQSRLPVLCVGGVVVGGSGKTPTLHALLFLLQKRGVCQSPIIITRGYGGALRGPVLVDPAIHTSFDVGDEALLHARHARTLVSRNRAQGAKLAESMGADFIFLDDGLQNNTLQKTFSLLVLDSTQGLGNGLTLPAGPLREPFETALRKADCVLQIDRSSVSSKPFQNKRPSFHAQMRPEPSSKPEDNRDYIGFAGIGIPEKFKQTLEVSGYKIQDFIPFPDHYPYTDKDMERLLHKATNSGALLITTEKDHVRIPPAYRGQVLVLPVSLEIDNEEGLVSIISKKIGRAG